MLTGMALVRILVDGYSLLHNWPQLAPGAARHSAEARDELVHRLTLYRDAIGTPITIVFDGSGSRHGKVERTPTPELEGRRRMTSLNGWRCGCSRTAKCWR